MTAMQVTPLAAECQLCGEVIPLDQGSYETEADMMADLMVQLDKHNETCAKLAKG